MNNLTKIIRRLVGYDKLMEKLNFQELQLFEIRKAQMFNDTTSVSNWLIYKDFSLGGAAIDYGCAYTLYRVLNQMRPNSILEFGLGQSSKLIHQYASYFNKNALTIEHSKEWLDFFQKDIDKKYNVNVKIVDLEEIEYKQKKTLTYKNVQSVLYKNKYDFVFVDGPYGFDKDGDFDYSRTQIIEVAKYNLNESFCIIIDDYEREGEQNTSLELMNALDDLNIDYCYKVYSASKKHFLICSKDLFF